MAGIANMAEKVASKLGKEVRALPPVYAARRAAALMAAPMHVDNARDRLAALSPRPASGWREPEPSPRDPSIDLSIIVPVYNEEPFVGECLDSILAQDTASSFEVIVIDDGSTDGSGAIVDARESADPRVRVVHQDNRGFSGARNAGLDLARGGGLMFVDSDDRLAPGYVEALMSVFRRGGCDVAQAGMTRMRADGRLTSTRTSMACHGAPFGRVYSASKWRSIRLPEGFWYEDTALGYFVLADARVEQAEDYGYLYRQHPASITRTARGKAKSLDTYWIVEEMGDWARRLGLPMGQFMYDKAVRQFGPLLLNRTDGFLGDEGLPTVFFAACDYLEGVPEFAGVRTSLGGRWADVDEALRTRNYKLWRVACGA